MENLNSAFHTSLISFDEGLLGSDKDLACAVWRTLIRDEINPENKDENDATDTDPMSMISHPSADPRALESLVSYIRMQVRRVLTV